MNDVRRFISSPKYSNMLFDLWETKGSDNTWIIPKNVTMRLPRLSLVRSGLSQADLREILSMPIPHLSPDQVFESYQHGQPSIINRSGSGSTLSQIEYTIMMRVRGRMANVTRPGVEYSIEFHDYELHLPSVGKKDETTAFRVTIDASEANLDFIIGLHHCINPDGSHDFESTSSIGSDVKVQWHVGVFNLNTTYQSIASNILAGSRSRGRTLDEPVKEFGYTLSNIIETLIHSAFVIMPLLLKSNTDLYPRIVMHDHPEPEGIALAAHEAMVTARSNYRAPSSAARNRIRDSSVDDDD